MTARSFRCRAILFDLDGVLVDSAECVEQTWRAWATHHGLDPEHVIALAHGRRAIEAVHLIAPELRADAELEDTPAGIESAQAAGMRSISIATTYPPGRLRTADAVVTQLLDLSVVQDGDEIRIDIPMPPAP